MINVSVVGCTGIVGGELCKLLEKKKFPLQRLRLFASEKSTGKTLSFKDQLISIETIEKDSFDQEDLIFFCTDAELSKKHIPKCQKTNAIIIDLSSAFREEKNVPLIIPEINFDEMKNHRLIASPNCVASIMALAIVNIHKKYKIKRIIASTYQAASGGGKALLQKLLEQSKDYLQTQYIRFDSNAFNTYLHESKHFSDRYSFEEKKIIGEIQKILKDPEMKISVTAVRVPVMRVHSISMNKELYHPFALDDIEEILQNTKGVSLIHNHALATALHANENENVLCSRVRVDPTHDNTLEMWVVADQLLKGAALNALQIAEKLVEKKSFPVRP